MAQSSFALLVLVNEAFGYTHQQTLNSSYCMIMSMLKEYNFSMNQRNKTINGEEEINEGEEWTTVIDFDTGQPKRIKKVKSI